MGGCGWRPRHGCGCRRNKARRRTATQARQKAAKAGLGRQPRQGAAEGNGAQLQQHEHVLPLVAHPLRQPADGVHVLVQDVRASASGCSFGTRASSCHTRQKSL